MALSRLHRFWGDTQISALCNTFGPTIRWPTFPADGVFQKASASGRAPENHEPPITKIGPVNYVIRQGVSGNCFPAREVGEQPKTRPAARNESEVHPMSPESTKPVDPSLSRLGEGCQGRTKAITALIRRGEASMTDCAAIAKVASANPGCRIRDVVVKKEICAGGRQRPAAGASGNPARPVWPGQKSGRLVVPLKRPITVEGRTGYVTCASPGLWGCRRATAGATRKTISSPALADANSSARWEVYPKINR